MGSEGARDREKWEELYASGARVDRPPSTWVLETMAALPNDGPVADIAGGNGRHAVPLARAGRSVVLVDIVEMAVAAARTREPSLCGIVAETTRLPLRRGRFDAVLVVNYLDRKLFPDLVALLAPGGYLVYETYTTAHLALVARGEARGPHSRAYVLNPGELATLARPLEIVSSFEGEVEDEAGRRCCARLVGQRAKSKAQRA